MSSTRRPIEALEYAKEFLKSMPVIEKAGAEILNSSLCYFWMAAPWRWTLGSLPTVPLASNTQDYTISVPTDLLYVESAYVADGTNTPRALEVVATLPTAGGHKGQPSRIALVSSALRVYPTPGTLLSSPTQTVYGLYKKKVPQITRTNMYTSGVQVFDDEWFYVFEDIVL